MKQLTEAIVTLADSGFEDSDVSDHDIAEAEKNLLIVFDAICSAIIDEKLSQKGLINEKVEIQSDPPA